MVESELKSGWDRVRVTRETYVGGSVEMVDVSCVLAGPAVCLLIKVG